MIVVIGLVSGLLAGVAATGVAWPLLRGTVPAGPAEAPEAAEPSRGDRARGLGWMAAAAALAVVLGLLLGRAVGDRDAGEEITGETAPDTPIVFFEERVADRPQDVAARLDLAAAYLDAGRAPEAIEEYLRILEIDPEIPEAHARLGLILSASGRPEEGLAAVRRSLELDPDYPEALFAKGVILVRDLDRPGPGAAALRAYLEAAPYGAHREEAEALLDRVEP